MGAFNLRAIVILITLTMACTRLYAEDVKARAAPVERKAARPAPDFPSLDSYYPEEARRAGQEGIAIIHFCVDANGKLTEPPTLAESSGNTVLDAGALNVANAGNGHYLAPSENGVPVPGCAKFRVAFKVDADADLPLNDPRFPTISARLVQLDGEFTRRMAQAMHDVERPAGRFIVAPGDPRSQRVIRQYARSLDAALDESAGITADFLEDVDYLQRSPDIPESQRRIFSQEWPDKRAALANKFRSLLGATRDIVRVMDELGDYISFATQRPSNAGTGADAQSQMPQRDPQVIAIEERARRALERLRAALQGSKGTPGAVDQ